MKKIFFFFLALFVFAVFLELAAKAVNKTVLKDKIVVSDLKTEFEEIYIPPFAQKEVGEYRVFVYGGSSVKGIPLPKVGFVSQLDYQLHKMFPNKNVRVHNLGWAGFNSTRIRYTFERTIPANPDLVIIYTGENEFIYPQLDYYFLVRGVTALKNRSDLAKLLMFAVKKDDSLQNAEVFSKQKKFPAYGESKIYADLKRRIFETNIKAIIEKAQKQNVRVLLVIPASNIDNWPPVQGILTNAKTPEDLQKNLQTIVNLINEKRLSEAEKLVDESLKKYPNDAWLYFLKGTIAKREGENAKEFMDKSRDLDLVPWRATTKYMDFMRGLENGKSVRVLDVEKILSQNSPNNLTGFNFLLDGTHPSKEGSYLISKSIADFMMSENLVRGDWKAEAIFSQGELFDVMRITSEDDFYSYLATAELVIKRPLANLRAAKYFIKKAQEINPTNWETWAVGATIANIEGGNQQAIEYLRQAERLRGSKISKEDSLNVPYLSEVIGN